MIDLTDKLMELYQPRERDPMRVSVTQIHALLNGWEDRPIGVPEAIRMFNGTIRHKIVEELLPKYEKEVKVEYPYKDIVVVGMADLVAEDHLIELKTSANVMDKAKEWHYTQAVIYNTIFEKDYTLIMQPVHTYRKFYLKRLRKVGRNDEKVHQMLDIINNIKTQ